MSTNALGPNTRNITANIPAEDYLGLTRLASSSGRSISAYLRALTRYAVQHNLIAGHNQESYARWEAAIRDKTSPLPEIEIEIKAGPPARLEAPAISERTEKRYRPRAPLSTRLREAGDKIKASGDKNLADAEAIQESGEQDLRDASGNKRRGPLGTT